MQIKIRDILHLLKIFFNLDASIYPCIGKNIIYFNSQILRPVGSIVIEKQYIVFLRNLINVKIIKKDILSCGSFDLIFNI